MSGMDIIDEQGMNWGAPTSGWAAKGNLPSVDEFGALTYSRGPQSDTGFNGSDVSPAFAIAASVFSDLTRAYAGFSAVRAAQQQAKSQASAYGHRARMLQLDQRAAELQAEGILQAGQSQAGQVSMEASQRQGEIAAGTAARGITAGTGSAAEVAASEKIVEALDLYHINVNTVRQANAARLAAVGIGNEALGLRTTGINLRRSARVAAPEADLLAGLGTAAVNAYRINSYRSAR